MKKLQIFTVLIMILMGQQAMAQEGTIRGTVIDDANGETIPFANVYLPELGTGTTSDLDGVFSLVVATGTYTLEFSYIGYEDLKVTDVVVAEGEVTNLDQIRIKEPESGTLLQEVVVTAQQIRNTEAALMTIQKKSATVLDGVSSQAIKRSGDGDAGEAIKRVTGVSVEGGKHVYVRGLGDRYTKVLFNGMNISGLDPDRNSVELDIFPTNILDNILVYKTAAPDLPGDFTGGIVNIITKDFPEELTSTISLGIGFNPSMNMNSNFVTYQGGGTDWLGMDDGTRALPFNRSLDIPTRTSNSGQVLIPTLTSAFDQTMAVNRATSGLNTNLSYSIGNQINKGDFTFGYLGAFNYRSSYTYYDDYEVNDFRLINGAFDGTVSRTGELGIEDNFWNALAGVSMKYKNHKLGVQYLRFQNGISRAGLFKQVDVFENPGTIIRNNLEYEERRVDNIIVSGKHMMRDANLEVNWNFMPNFIEVDEPDIRLTGFEVLENGQYQIAPSVGADITRTFRNLQEDNYNGKLNIVKKLNIGERESKIKLGGQFSLKERDFGIYNYNFRILQQGKLDLQGNPNNLLIEDNIWSPETNSGTYIQGNIQPSNIFNARQNVYAAYIMNELPLSDKFKAIYGLRMEKAENYFTGVNNLQTEIYMDSLVLDELDFLPSLNLVYNLNDDSNLRFSASRSVARPTFKEKSLIQLQDRITGRTFLGNINLTDTKINNLDIRWENFFNSGEMFSVSGFYKQMINPIEIVVFDPTDPSSFQPKSQVVYEDENGVEIFEDTEANVYGIEFELRKSLGFIGLYDFNFMSNITLVHSSIIDGNGRERALQGQSPFILNTVLNYRNDSGWEANLNYNFQGKRISVAARGDDAPVTDLYEMPYHLLNLKLSKSFDENKWGLSFTVDNLLDSQRQKEWQFEGVNAEIFERFSPGRTFSMNLRYRIN